MATRWLLLLVVTSIMVTVVSAKSRSSNYRWEISYQEALEFLTNKVT